MVCSTLKKKALNTKMTDQKNTSNAALILQYRTWEAGDVLGTDSTYHSLSRLLRESLWIFSHRQ